MTGIDPRIAEKIGPSNGSSGKFVVASLPFGCVLLYFLYEAYMRTSQPIYNIPAWVTDDAVIQNAANATKSLVPLMDMVYVTLSFCVFWACCAGYTLGYLRLRAATIADYLQNGQSSLGNVVYENKRWIFGFRYYGYVSYANPENPNENTIRKNVRIWEPYTRELVPILTIPGHPYSGQGKQDVEYAHLLTMRERPRENFLGIFCLVWTLICALVPIFFMHQMAIIDAAEAAVGITDDYDNVDKGWRVYWTFMVFGVVVVAGGGTAVAWLLRRYWLLKQGRSNENELSMHGFDRKGTAAKSADVDPDAEYQRMSFT